MKFDTTAVVNVVPPLGGLTVAQPPEGGTTNTVPITGFDCQKPLGAQHSSAGSQPKSAEADSLVEIRPKSTSD